MFPNREKIPYISFFLGHFWGFWTILVILKAFPLKFLCLVNVIILKKFVKRAKREGEIIFVKLLKNM